MGLAQSLERVLMTYRRTSGPRDPRVEAMEFPRMVCQFRQMIRAGYIPPTQQEFSETIACVVGAGPREAVEARAGRTHTSLIPQWHALLTLREAGFLVCWDDELDMKHGLDLVVADSDGYSVGLAFRAWTRVTQKWAAHKAGKPRRSLIDVYEIVLQKGGYSAGPYYLYPPGDLCRMVRGALGEVRDRQARRNYLDGYREGFQHGSEAAV